MLLDNKTLVLKSLAKTDENDAFDGSYLDQMSVSDGLSDMASLVSRNDHVRDIGTSVDELGKKFPRKAYSRSASSASSSYTPRGRRLKKSVTSLSIWSLQSVPMSPTSPADVEIGDMMPVYTSFRDAHGYSALSNLRRQRSINRDIESRIGGFNQSFAIVGPPIPESRPLSLDLAESHTSGSSALPTPSPLEHQYGRKVKTASSARGNEFLGLTLPCELTDFFMVAESQFKGSWAANFNGISTSIPQESTIPESEATDILKGKASHDVTHCLSCMDISNVTGLHHVVRQASIESNEAGSAGKTDCPDKIVTLPNGPTNSETPSSGSVLEKFLKGKRGEAITSKERSLIKREILRLVVNLSSAVTSKSHQQSLRSWKENVPQMFEDLCLYSQVIEQMSLYNYKLTMRRFIQSFFEPVKFTQLLDQADAIIKKHSS
ncbi:rapamycin-insensitive companion of mTOR-like [Dendronephthya gigantea]|nr:rapamycin-insensitive companion of mTOR-like [Dendronephthya gigantea]